jgi:intracellular septation protein
MDLEELAHDGSAAAAVERGPAAFWPAWFSGFFRVGLLLGYDTRPFPAGLPYSEFMRFVLDFFPLVAFWAAYKLANIYVATGVLIVACAVQIGVHWVRTRTVKPLHWITGVLVLVFGTATILLHNPRFIQWKITILMWSLGVAFLVSHFVGAKPLSRRFLETVLGEAAASSASAQSPAPAGASPLTPLSNHAWHLVNAAWVAFFALVGAVNLYIAYRFSESTWVNFKAYGVSVLLFLFLLPQVFWLAPKEAAGPDDGAADKS